MAKSNYGIVGAFNGTVGPVVGYDWKGRNCMRGRVAPSNPRTERQQRGRSVFGATAHLWGRMRRAAEIGLRGEARAEGVEEINLFVRYNRQCISAEGAEVRIDYARLRLAEGNLAGVQFAAPTRVGELGVEVGFSPLAERAGSMDDYVLLFAYAAELEEGKLSQPVERRAGQVGITLPSHWSGQQVQLYGFAWSGDLEASPSVFIGTLI